MPPKGTKVAPPALTADISSPAAQQQQANSIGIADFELPKTSLTKLAKGSIPDNVKMQQDVVLALLRSSTVFISYLTAAAHDQALARSGRSITASDVLKAIAELDFGPADDLIPQLEMELAAYRTTIQAAKNSRAKVAAAARARGKRSTLNPDDVDMEEEDGVEDDGLETGDPDGEMDEAEATAEDGG